MRPPREDTVPWYRQFWPWFLISLPGAVVVASMVTIYIAVSTRDGLVKDDYYKEGLAIHKDVARTQAATALGVKATARYDTNNQRLALQLNGAAVGQLDKLIVVLFHPTRDRQDQRVELQAAGHGLFVGDIQALAPANWQISAEPATSQWRISGRLAVPQLTQAELQ